MVALLLQSMLLALLGARSTVIAGAVMVAYAMHLLRTEGAQGVRIHPDGEHGKQFDFAGRDRNRAREPPAPIDRGC